VKRIDLRTAFVVVAVVEAAYGIIGVLVPPGLVATVVGWDLSPDGQWVTKLMGLALLAQAAMAWVLRDRPVLAVAWIFAAYQAGAATADWVMWLVLADEGIFTNRLAQVSVIISIPLHYGIAALLLAGTINETRQRRHEAIDPLAARSTGPVQGVDRRGVDGRSSVHHRHR
jgi:hypothetical protein